MVCFRLLVCMAIVAGCSVAPEVKPEPEPAIFCDIPPPPPPFLIGTTQGELWCLDNLEVGRFAAWLERWESWLKHCYIGWPRLSDKP